AATQYRVPLAGLETIIPTPEASLETSSVSFGEIELGAPPARRTLQLKNTGNVPLAVEQYNTEGPFSARTECPQMLDKGADCDFELFFAPRAPGRASGRLMLHTQAGERAVSLEGFARVVKAEVSP